MQKLKQLKSPEETISIVFDSSCVSTFYNIVHPSGLQSHVVEKGIETIINFASKHHKTITFDFAL
jgi:hypothetical protein